MLNEEKNKRPKVGLALSGGSALGIAHVGVIKALREADIPIDFVSGTSAGSIVATALAFELSLEKMIEFSKGLSWKSMSKFGYSKMGLNSNEPIGELVQRMVGDVKIEDAKIPLAIVATDIDDGEEKVFTKGRVAGAVMASTCLPVYYVPVKVRGEKLVDGGLVENLPLSPLEKMGADIKIGVNLERWKKYRKTKNFLDVIFNSYGTLIRPQSIEDSRRAQVMIEPHLEDFSPSDFEKYDELMQKGYEAATEKIGEIKKLLGEVSEEAEKPKTFWQKVRDFFQKPLF